MYRIILIAIFINLWQISFAQIEKFEVEGAIIISDNEDPSPVAGTIRWTGQDFEGFDGTRWRSLTCCSTDTPVGSFYFVEQSIVENTLADTEVRVELTFSEGAQAYIEYGTTQSLGSETNKELSFDYSTHRQWIRNLQAATTYYYRINGENEAGDLAQSSIFTFTTTGNNSPAVCGNGILEAGEQCDDGNNINGDGCNNQCQNENLNSGGIVSDDYVTTFFNQNFGGGPMTYQQIASNAPSEYNLQTDNEYLGEYLRQNPDVSWWNQNTNAQTIEGVDAPAITGTILNISPSGGDDAGVIQAAITQVGSGGAIDGGGQTFKVSTLSLAAFAQGVTVRNFNITPVQNERTLFNILASDITFINVNIDFNGKFVRRVIDVHPQGDRFSIVECTIENVKANSAGSALVHILSDVEDVYIVNNVMKDYIAPDTDNQVVMRAVAFFGTAGQAEGLVAKRGITASNDFENIQSGETGFDSEIIALKSLGLKNEFEGRHLFIANKGINAGKRMIKAQSGGVDAHSNFNWWKDYQGPEGVRNTRAHFANHGVSNTRWTNNAARTDHANPVSEAIFFVMATRESGWIDSADFDAHDIIFSHNIYEVNSNTEGQRILYAFMNTDDEGDNVTSWSPNSEITYNTIRGTGELWNYYWFRTGGNPRPPTDPLGLEFPHHGNVFSVPNTNGDYKASN